MVKIRLISDIHFDAGLNGLEEHSTKDPNHSPFGSYFAKELKKEPIDWRSISPDFSNEYCKIKWLDYNDYLKLLNS